MSVLHGIGAGGAGMSRTKRESIVRIQRAAALHEERRRRKGITGKPFPAIGSTAPYDPRQIGMFEEENLPQDHLPPESKRATLAGGPRNDSK